VANDKGKNAFDAVCFFRGISLTPAAAQVQSFGSMNWSMETEAENA
jgi:hypothetical protein